MLIIQPKRASKIENMVIFSLSLTFYKKFKLVRHKKETASIQITNRSCQLNYAIIVIRNRNIHLQAYASALDYLLRILPNAYRRMR